MDATRELTLRVPADYAACAELAEATPQEVAVILGYGVDLFRRGAALVSEAGAASVARLELAMRAEQDALAEQYAMREAALARELAQARDALAAADTASRRATAAAVEVGLASAEARSLALGAELREARAEIASLLRAQASAVLVAAAEARREAAAESRSRQAQLEGELAAAREAPALATASEVATLATRFDRVFSALTPSSAKGRAGEAALGALLLRLYPDAEVVDCSAEPGQGDATLCLVREGRPFRIMVESKNVARVRGDDVAKFGRDCANRARAGDAHAAIFAALAAPAIPHKGAVAFEVVADLPVLFLADALAQPDALRLGVEALLFAALARPAGGPAPPDAWDDVRDAVSLAFGVLARQAARSGALRATAEALLLSLSAFENEASVAVGAINALWASRPTLRRADPVGPVTPAASAASAAPAAASAASALRVRRFIDTRGRHPSRAEVIKDCLVPEAALRRCGGVRALVALALELPPSL